MNRSTAARIERAEAAIRSAGFELRYVQFCEDTDTPGPLPGLYAGVTDRRNRVVKIKRVTQSKMRAETLEHELHHVQDPTWDCGNHVAQGGAEIEIGSRIVDPGRLSKGPLR